METVYLLIPIVLGLVLVIVGLGGMIFSRHRGLFAVLLLLGLVAGGSPYLYNHFTKTPLDPIKKQVNGEWHLTATGWDKPASDYAKLAEEPDLVVLQMANPDVTDDTLKHLSGMLLLKELDVSDSAITDEGLARIAKLPSLEKLRLKGTKITDEGFRAHLMPGDWLLMVDVRNTVVKRKTLQEWKNVYADKREYVN